MDYILYLIYFLVPTLGHLTGKFSSNRNLKSKNMTVFYLNE